MNNSKNTDDVTIPKCVVDFARSIEPKITEEDFELDYIAPDRAVLPTSVLMLLTADELITLLQNDILFEDEIAKYGLVSLTYSGYQKAIGK